ncbi:nitrilase-related carbon-nitrogen hydrolase [Demetria terragena]|uniref:nitrilase-related carbon-nitrogen hydrolase n=1 Tax=Demetria terragena TaxID=63959 RepID=UPI000375C51D|nr:nitrilase-related carbon-nitrogen hydrolase [Demetria terragena]
MTKVAACQVAPLLGDPAANRELVADAVSDAAKQSAELVVLPELVSSGYMFRDQDEARASAEPADGQTLQLWGRLARDHGVVLVGGFCEAGPTGELYISSAIVDPSGTRAIYRKAHLWDQERLIFSRGNARPPVVDTAIGRIATMICYDLEFPEWVRIPALAGADLLAAPVNWPTGAHVPDQVPTEVVRTQADSSVNRMAVVACDRAGVERGVEWVGGSVIVDSDGWILAGGSRTPSSQTLCADLDLTASRNKNVGGLSDIHADRRPDLY